MLWFAMPTWLRLSRWYEGSEGRRRGPSRIPETTCDYGMESVDVLLSRFGS